MKIDCFQQKADAFGGDLSRWPPADQKAAGELLRNSAQARRIIADALALDAQLRGAGGAVDGARVEKNAAAIFARIDALPARRPAAPPARPVLSPRWSVGFIAAMALMGVVSGALSPTTQALSLDGGVVDVTGGTSYYYSTGYLLAWAR